MDENNNENDQHELDLILAEWQTCLEMADSISRRRDTMNNIFVTLNLAVLAAVSIMFDIRAVVLNVAGIVMCVIWMFFIQSYKMLNSAKFKQINEMEERLPYQPFNKEWEDLKSEKRKKKYNEQTKLEKILPIAFIVFYVVITAILIVITILEA